MTCLENSMIYYIMKADSSYAAGAHKVASAINFEAAAKKARDLDHTLNGRSMGKTWVLDEDQYYEWYQRNVEPLYECGYEDE
jgi:hypothetical protein